MIVTEDVARALDVAARRWPAACRGELLARLAVERAEEISRARERRAHQVVQLLDQLDGALPPQVLADLEDWDQ